MPSRACLPPQIVRMDAGSFPVGYLVLESETESLGKLADLTPSSAMRPLAANPRAGDGGHGAVWVERALDRDSRPISQRLAHLQLELRMMWSQALSNRQHRGAGRQLVRQGPNAARSLRRDDQGSPGFWQDPACAWG